MPLSGAEMVSAYSWDAMDYEKVSANVQREWGQQLVNKRKWIGNEIVVDAGAGPGNLTRSLCEKLPNGYVYAVDIDSNMVAQAEVNLSNYKNVEILHSPMETVILPRAIDVIFSNAATHWVLDQMGLFLHLWQLLKSPGGELLVDFGGQGNLDRMVQAAYKVKESDEFKKYFRGWRQPWYFPRAEDVERILQKIGFKEVQITQSKHITGYPDRDSFAAFAKTVLMKPFFGNLPDENNRSRFLDAFLGQVECMGFGWSMDWVRLCVTARK
jgi:trans-aconitate 2-methyltransferase